MGELIPCGLTEVLPGDSFQQSTSLLVRTNPLLAPIMHPVDIRIHHWFVPLRLVWDNFEPFITGGPDGDDATVPPYFETGVGGAAVGSLQDYMGIPTGIAGIKYSALPRRAYGLIWNEWYRDQDLQTELVVSKGDGLDATTNVALQNVCWEKDYFTSARPWPQKGPAITVPLSGVAPVVTTGVAPVFDRGGATAELKLRQTNSELAADWSATVTGTSGDAIFGSVTGLEADLDNATAVEINALREAFALQRYAEARARYGSRYTEYLRYLGVRSSDARLQRPEYLGGGRQRLQISEVLQTGVTTDGDDSEGPGNLFGHGIGAMRSNRYRRFFEEHGYVISLLSVKPKTMYTQGLPRTFSRLTKEDYFQKELQHIGQQEILKQEIYAAGGVADDDVWGYQDRYDEYRRQENTVSGEFRTTELDYWHMARIFAGPAAPALNADFVKSDPTKRVFTVTDSDQDALWIQCHHSIQARRMVAAKANSFIY